MSLTTESVGRIARGSLPRTNVAGKGWTEEREQFLREKATEKWSAAEIASGLGISRNAVIGKAHRLKIALDSDSSSNVQRRTISPAQRSALLSRQARKAAEPLPVPTSVPMPASVDAEAAPGFIDQVSNASFGPRTLFDLRGCHCRWPLWGYHESPGVDGLYCGDRRQEDHRSYCARHAIQSRAA